MRFCSAVFELASRSRGFPPFTFPPILCVIAKKKLIKCLGYVFGFDNSPRSPLNSHIKTTAATNFIKSLSRTFVVMKRMIQIKLIRLARNFFKKKVKNI